MPINQSSPCLDPNAIITFSTVCLSNFATDMIMPQLELGRFRVHSIRFDFDSKQFDSGFFRIGSVHV